MPYQQPCAMHACRNASGPPPKSSFHINPGMGRFPVEK